MTEATIFARLIRVGDRRAGHTTIYVVAHMGPVSAMAIMRAKLGHEVETEDLGRVSGALLTALNLAPGEIAKT